MRSEPKMRALAMNPPQHRRRRCSCAHWRGGGPCRLGPASTRKFTEVIEKRAAPVALPGAGDVHAADWLAGFPQHDGKVPPMLFELLKKRVINDDRAHLREKDGRCRHSRARGESPRQPNQWEKKRCRYSRARFKKARPDDTFAMTELSWVYLALGRNADALRLSRQAADTISLEGMLRPV